MEFQEIINLLVSNGIGVCCIVYFMFRDYKFMSTLQTSLTQLNDTISLIKDLISKGGV